jgi:hypothetical protein
MAAPAGRGAGANTQSGTDARKTRAGRGKAGEPDEEE